MAEFQATGMERGKSIFIPDFDKLVKDLKALDPQLRKDFNKALNAAAKPLVTQARTFVPAEIRSSSGGYIWRPVGPTYQTAAWINDTQHRGRDAGNRWVWRADVVRRNIKITRTSSNRVPFGYNKVATAALAVVNRSAPGAIYELAGRGTERSRSRTVSRSRNPKAQEDFRNLMLKDHPFTADARYGRILYRAAANIGPEVRRAVEKVVDERLRSFARG